jgi:hypothetical protein
MDRGTHRGAPKGEGRPAAQQTRLHSAGSRAPCKPVGSHGRDGTPLRYVTLLAHAENAAQFHVGNDTIG